MNFLNIPVFVVFPHLSLSLTFLSLPLVGGANLPGTLQQAEQHESSIQLHQRPDWMPLPLPGQPVWPGHPALSQDAWHFKWPPLWICKTFSYFLRIFNDSYQSLFDILAFCRSKCISCVQSVFLLNLSIRCNSPVMLAMPVIGWDYTVWSAGELYFANNLKRRFKWSYEVILGHTVHYSALRLL